MAEVKVEYLQKGTLGPLTLKEVILLRDYLRNPEKELSTAESSVIEKFDLYLDALIQETTTVGKIY